MTYVLRWWIATTVLGLMALPLTYRAFGKLPDRGYAASRTLGMLILVYGIWIGGSLHVVPYGGRTVVEAVVCLCIVAIALGWRDRHTSVRWVWDSRRYIFCVEVLFLLVLIATVYLRAFQPDWYSSERPFEFADLNAVSRTHHFPPEDPWLSGHVIGYYYFGYLVQDSMAKLTATPSRIALNLGLSQTASLIAITMFCLVVNGFVALNGSKTVRSWCTLSVGLFGVGILLVIGNLEGVVEVAAAHNWIPHALYMHLEPIPLGMRVDHTGR